MSAANRSRAVRARLVAALRAELLGPSAPDEVIYEFPTSRYVVGRLAPCRTSVDDFDAEVSAAENDTLGGDGPDDGEDGATDSAPPLVIAFNPSSIGLSFLVTGPDVILRAEIEYGDYRRHKDDAHGSHWRRSQRSGRVDGITVSTLGALPSIALSKTAVNAKGIVVEGLDDPQLTLEGVVHDVAGHRAISLFLVNRRTKAEIGDRTKDERWIFQPRLTVLGSHPTSSVFVAKDHHGGNDASADVDGDEATTALLYRSAREFATGHGVAVGWDVSNDRRFASRVFTEFMPQHEVPQLIAPSEQTGGATLDMKSLAEASGAQLHDMMAPMVTSYAAWVVAAKAHNDAEIEADARLKDAAKVNLENCERCCERIRAGLELLKTDAKVAEAFRFANRVMWDQRIHSLWASENRKHGKILGDPAAYDLPKNRTWRPFQMGFILLNLVGLADEDSKDRKLVDLLWFPTGGGKTEAYLGLSAFTLALRRLRGDRRGMIAGAGVSIIMRYTLRLLTIQQFQRAAALICACEVERLKDKAKWGQERFQIGVWVGRATTPNNFEDSRDALETLRQGKKPREGSPVQLVACPRCGAALVNDKGVPLDGTYLVNKAQQRTLVCCANDECSFAAEPGLPVVVVDDEIYRTAPSLVVATVDKFARLPFRGETRALFGLRDSYSPTLGHLTAAHERVGSKKIEDVSDAKPAKALLPPELIIQDELHLISGPLGTMVGLYEAAVDRATSLVDDDVTRIPAKVIASTATIRRAAQQTRQLYARDLAIFPPSALDSQDSFFARELPIDPDADAAAGRLFLGVNAPGSSTKTLLVRVYSLLLAAASTEADVDAADPYLTLAGYFNSLRALGGAKRLVEDDVALVRLKYLQTRRQQPQFTRRWLDEPDELTSRIDSWRIPALLKKLDLKFPRDKGNRPVDVLLATNMISVGVDIDRLGMMVVTGQPKTTAEYIQATSRVGRKYPGLVVTMYNWMNARDLSHYERFESYHAALYKHVEAISVTPFSSRALDRGLRGVFAAIARLTGADMASEPNAENFEATDKAIIRAIDELVARAERLVGKENAELVRARLLSHRDQWSHLAESLLRYCWLDDSRPPPNNSKVLLRTSGTQNEGVWNTPGSLREVEPTAAFFLDEGDA